MDIARDAAGGGGAAPPAAGRDGGSAYRQSSASTNASSATSASSRTRTQSPGPPPARPGISQYISEIRAAFSARFYLFELEAKRAAWSAAYMLAFAVAAALLGVTAWLVLIGALVYGAVAAGVPWVIAAMVAIALHAIAVFLLVRAIRAMVDDLTFAATRRTLSKADSAKAADGSGA